MEGIVKKMVKSLGSNEKRIRDRAVKSLKKYFSSDKVPFSDMDFTKIWRGLFYSKYHFYFTFISYSY